MKIGSQHDFVAGLLFAATGAGFALGAGNYSYGASANPGPGYFPLWLGILMTVLGLVVIYQSLIVDRPGGDKIGKIAWRPLLVILGAVLIFGWALPRLGLAVTVPLLVVLASLAGSHFKLLPTLALAAALAVGCWAVFVKGLSLTIPVWPTILG